MLLPLGRLRASCHLSFQLSPLSLICKKNRKNRKKKTRRRRRKEARGSETNTRFSCCGGCCRCRRLFHRRDCRPHHQSCSQVRKSFDVRVIWFSVHVNSWRVTAADAVEIARVEKVSVLVAVVVMVLGAVVVVNVIAAVRSCKVKIVMPPSPNPGRITKQHELLLCTSVPYANEKHTPWPYHTVNMSWPCSSSVRQLSYR